MEWMEEFGKPMICDFCGKDVNQFNLNVMRGNHALICFDCIRRLNEIVNEKTREKYEQEKMDLLPDRLPLPTEIKAYLDEYVVGQDYAKKVLSVAVYNHYKRIKYGSSGGNKSSEFKDIELDKSNILLLGPTGSGKTLLASSLAKKLNVPFAIADATTLTEAGYVGEDVENILLKLIQAADGDVARAENGIIFIDEIDKISMKGENVSITRDVSGEGVQQALLKIIEGTIASVPPQGGRKHPNQEMITINTKNILFICGGAFVGLDHIVEERVNVTPIGFGSDIKRREEKDLVELYKNLSPEDLIKFGLIPELIGRLPVVCFLNPLTESDLVRIIKEPKNSIIKQYMWNFKIDDVKLEIEDSAIEAIAKMAYQQKTGARGLRAIFEKMMLDIMFEIPSKNDAKEVIITDKVVCGEEEPKIITGKKATKKNKNTEKTA